MSKLNEKQKSAVEAIVRGENVFLTGPAGTGKSFTLKEVLRACTHRSKVAVTATTGSAAHLIGGRTVHSFLGIGLGTASAHGLATNTRTKNKKLYKKLSELTLLVIEEISMMDAALLVKISDYLSIIRNSSKPFGGVQVLFIGDFCQLPPVGKGRDPQFCFKSPLWAQLNLKVVHLTDSIRHQSDPLLQQVLEAVRWGKCTEEIQKIILSFDFDSSTVKPTRLYPVNIDVDKINEAEINRLIDQGIESHVYDTLYQGATAKRWSDSNKVPEQVKVCVGAQVVVTWNVNQAIGIVNGTRGVVTSIKNDSVRIQLKDRSEYDVAFVTVKDDFNSSVTYMPLRLAYALTIHRCQGMTLDCVEVDLGDTIFEYGQAYTALSRVRDSKSIRVIQLSMKSFKCHHEVIDFYKSLTH